MAEHGKTLIVFGGSFDPPHVAHVQLPQQVMGRIGADGVIYVPAAVSPFKVDQPPTDDVHRLAMLRLALAEQPWATIDTSEVDRAQAREPSYTIDTVRTLRDAHGDQVCLRLLIGGDQLRQFDQWKDWRGLIELAEPVVVLRPPDTREALLAALPPVLADAGDWRGRLVDLPTMDVSSTAIRERLARKESVSGMICPAVASYIFEHGLYGVK